MSSKVFVVERVMAKIHAVDNSKQREYYDLLYRTIIDHFLAYRISSTKIFSQSALSCAD
jgi:hypothetical protein